MMKEKDSHPISFIVTEDNSHTLYSERFKATYHSIRGAISESSYVFIKNGLDFFYKQFQPKDISVLEVGFGTGLNAFMTYHYSKENHININYHSIEAYPISFTEVSQLNYPKDFSDQDKIVFNQLHLQEWNKKTHVSNLFILTKQLCLLENFNTQQKFDIIYFDAFSPSEQPELWTVNIFKEMYNLLNVNGVLVTYCAQGQMKRNMKQTGFKIQSLPGALGKREMTRGLK